MVPPIESPWVISYLTSSESHIVSLAIFEIFGIKDIFPVELLTSRSRMQTAQLCSLAGVS